MILHRRVSRLGILWIICVIAYCFIMVLLSFRVYLLDSLSSSLNEWLLSCLINGGIYFSIYNLVVLQNELYVRETVHHQYNDVNNQQDATTFSFISLFKSAQHVSGDNFAHPQEHFLTVYTAFGTMHRHCCRPVPRLRRN